jgi:hypothetical protein
MFSLIYFQNDMSIECRLCSPTVPPLGAADGGYTFLRHLSAVHGVPQPGRLVTRLLEPDSGAFTYRRLRAEHEDLHHDPLVNLNPVAGTGTAAPDTGVLETAAPAAASRSLERRKSGEGKTAVALNTVSHLCIVCGRSFSSSEEVQCHLLVEHVAAAASAAAGGGETMPPPPAVKVEEAKIVEEEEILSAASSGPSDAFSNRKA